MAEDATIESVLSEERVFPPPPEVSRSAYVKSFEEYEKIYSDAAHDLPGFWAKQAEALDWFEPWETVLEWEPPHAKWFSGGKINAAYNCLDRHLETHGEKTAIIWEGEPGEQRRLTYRELHREVAKFSNVLRSLGIEKGDRVAVYMPLVPELAIAILACARIGAPHTVIFGGFSADSIRDRVNDCGCKAIITADGGYRRGREIRLKPVVDEALKDCPTIENVVVFKRTGSDIEMKEGRDQWWADLMKDASADHTAESLDAEHPLYILYTSGTTGKPKGILHTTGGYLTQAAYSTKLVFDLKDDDIYWCTADIGWVTGHSYVVYGPLANAATVLMYEGAPNHPEPDRFWDIIERHKVTIFYTAPTAIRSFIRWGSDYPERHDLSSLRVIGTVGEPINPEAWMWYHRVIGKEKCPIVDTWWQTETGTIMISPLPGATPTVPGSATRPLPGIVVDIVRKDGKPAGIGEGGYLVVKEPWPSMLRTLWGDDERYKLAYWSEIEGYYFAGDGARCDERGYYWIMGRVDDVINVSGHRLGTAEIESALVSHEKVAEAAVVGRPDEIKGQAIAAFVTLEGDNKPSEELRSELREHVAKEIGSLARPDDIRFTDALPKTRSGKIMRRLLRELATSGEVAGDVTTLEDSAVLDRLREEES